MDLILLIITLVICYVWGSRGEKRHYTQLAAREAALPKIPVINVKRDQFPHDVASTELVHGSVVMGADYFKTVLAGIVSIFGGNIATLESVLERGRREAVLRLKEKALGADYIANLRYETTTVSDQTQREGTKVEIFVYATAIYLK